MGFLTPAIPAILGGVASAAAGALLAPKAPKMAGSAAAKAPVAPQAPKSPQTLMGSTSPYQMRSNFGGTFLSGNIGTPSVGGAKKTLLGS